MARRKGMDKAITIFAAIVLALIVMSATSFGWPAMSHGVERLMAGGFQIVRNWIVII